MTNRFKATEEEGEDMETSDWLRESERDDPESVSDQQVEDESWPLGRHFGQKLNFETNSQLHIGVNSNSNFANQ